MLLFPLSHAVHRVHGVYSFALLGNSTVGCVCACVLCECVIHVVHGHACICGWCMHNVYAHVYHMYVYVVSDYVSCVRVCIVCFKYVVYVCDMHVVYSVYVFQV